MNTQVTAKVDMAAIEEVTFSTETNSSILYIENRKDNIYTVSVYGVIYLDIQSIINDLVYKVIFFCSIILWLTKRLGNGQNTFQFPGRLSRPKMTTKRADVDQTTVRITLTVVKKVINYDSSITATLTRP